MAVTLSMRNGSVTGGAALATATTKVEVRDRRTDEAVSARSDAHEIARPVRLHLKLNAVAHDGFSNGLAEFSARLALDQPFRRIHIIKPRRCPLRIMPSVKNTLPFLILQGTQPRSVRCVPLCRLIETVRLRRGRAVYAHRDLMVAGRRLHGDGDAALTGGRSVVIPNDAVHRSRHGQYPRCRAAPRNGRAAASAGVGGSLPGVSSSLEPVLPPVVLLSGFCSSAFCPLRSGY